MFELVDASTQDADIKVIGVGGGGGNAVEHMMASKIEGVEFICANTDAQALRKSTSPTILQIGEAVTKGLGAGADPEVGRKAALEDEGRIQEVLDGADMVFITAGMGGGTGTGGAPVIAKIAKDMGILTVAVVTKPFPFEMKKRLRSAEEGIKQLAEHVDSLIIIPNEKLLTVLGQQTSLMDAFKEANNVLYGAVQGISDLIIRPGVMNVDFADVRTVMKEKGNAMIGTGYASGENRASEAAELAIASPFLEDIDLSGAGGVLVNITAGMDLGIGEFVEVGNTIEGIASDETTVIVGTVLDPDMGDEIKVTVIATGLSHGKSIAGAAGATSSVRQEKVAHVAPINLPVHRNNEGQVDYPNYDKPTIMRNEAQRSGGLREVSSGGMDHLDVPAFLRRQAD